MKRCDVTLFSQCALAFLMSFQLIFALDWEPTNGPEGGSVQALLLDGSCLYAGVRGGVYKLDLVGGQWNPIVNGMTTPWTILSLARFKGTIFAGSESNGIFVSTDQGASWSLANSGLTRLSIGALVADDSLVYAASSGGPLYYSNNSGALWVQIPSNIPSLYGISIAVLGKSVLASAGYSGKGVYRSVCTNGVWKTAESSLSDIEIFSLLAVDPYVYAGGNGIYRSPDSGKTWVQSTGISLNTRVKSLAFGGSCLYASMENGTICRSQNEGLAWNQVGTNLPSKLWPYCLAASGATVYVGGQDDGVLVSADSGNTWGPLNPGLCRRRIFDVEAAGQYLYANSEFGRLFVSNRNGRNWSQVDPAKLGNSAVRCLGAKGHSIFAGTSGAGIFRSNDNGATWDSVNQFLTDRYIVSISVCDSVVYAGTTANCFQSRDDGARWIASNSGLEANCYVRGVVRIGGKLLLAADDSVYRSADNGATWTLATNGIQTNAIWCIASLGNNAYVGTWAGIFRTRDTGTTWTASNFGLPYKQVYALLAHNGVLFAGTDHGSVFVSRDSGAFWDPLGSAMPTSETNDVEGLAMSDSFLVAATMLSSVMRYPRSDMGVRNVPDHDTHTWASPRVFITPGTKPWIKVTYTMQRPGLAKIRVFDMTGRVRAEVTDYQKSPGRHTAEANLGAITTGFYLVRIQAEGIDEWNKFVLP
jgi:photosystem II stability/assembly factor-like uncharacterized protein